MVLNPCRDSHECQNLDPGGFLEEEDHKRWAEPAWHRFLLSRPPWALARTRGLDGSRGPDPALSHWPACMPGQGWPFVHTPLPRPWEGQSRAKAIVGFTDLREAVDTQNYR